VVKLATRMPRQPLAGAAGVWSIHAGATGATCSTSSNRASRLCWPRGSLKCLFRKTGSPRTSSCDRRCDQCTYCTDVLRAGHPRLRWKLETNYPKSGSSSEDPYGILFVRDGGDQNRTTRFLPEADRPRLFILAVSRVHLDVFFLVPVKRAFRRPRWDVHLPDSDFRSLSRKKGRYEVKIPVPMQHNAGYAGEELAGNSRPSHGRPVKLLPVQLRTADWEIHLSVIEG